MIYSKPIQVDLAHQYLNDVIRLHEGDALGAQLQISMYNNGDVFSLAGFTIKYDAVIAGYLAEQDATATVLTGTSNVIVVPITENMCAKSGTLEIDVKLKKTADNSVLFLQKFEAFVQRRVINEDVIIDVSGTTIGAKIAALEAKFPVATENIADRAVTSDKIGTGEVETVNIADSAVTANELGTEAVTTVKIHDGAVTSNKLGASAVVTQKIADRAVTSGKIGTGEVETVNIADSAVTANEIAASAVITSKIASGAVTSGKIDTGAVTETKIASKAVTKSKLGDEVVAVLDTVGDANDLLEAALNYQS